MLTAKRRETLADLMSLPRARTIEVLKLRGRRYALHAVFEAGDALTSPLLPGLRIPVTGVFGGRARA